jgi:hypothetical protein
VAVIMIATAKGYSEAPTTEPDPTAPPFIQVPGPGGMKAWSDGKSLLCVRDGKLVATIAVDGVAQPAAPAAGTPLYRADGTPAGWIGPEDSRPARLASISISNDFRETVTKSTGRFASSDLDDSGDPSGTGAGARAVHRASNGSSGSAGRKSARFYNPAAGGGGTGSRTVGSTHGSSGHSPKTYQ